MADEKGKTEGKGQGREMQEAKSKAWKGKQGEKPFEKKTELKTTAGGKGKGEDIRYIVRIANRDLDGGKTIKGALTGIKGISVRTADMLARAFEKESGISGNTLLGKLPEGKEKEIEQFLMNPEKHGMPEWALNRQKDYEEGKGIHLIENDLDFSIRKDLQRLSAIKSYRGLRHTWGLTVRGQRTRSTHRGKGGAVGVVKKDVKAGKGGGAKDAGGDKGKKG
ncbi:MAG: 30S ribosomal protein S13 [Candidatus Diapherotrites archaeon]